MLEMSDWAEDQRHKRYTVRVHITQAIALDLPYALMLNVQKKGRAFLALNIVTAYRMHLLLDLQSVSTFEETKRKLYPNNVRLLSALLLQDTLTGQQEKGIHLL
jgi:hypothetical protein